MHGRLCVSCLQLFFRAYTHLVSLDVSLGFLALVALLPEDETALHQTLDHFVLPDVSVKGMASKV